MVPYEATGKKLVDALKSHQVESVNFLAFSTNDFRYLFVSPLENMAELDKNYFEEFQNKIGNEAFGELMSGFTGYDEHGDYVLNLRDDLSYQPSGIDPRTEGQDYRRFTYWHITPEKMQEALSVAKEFKALNESKGSKVHYRIYQNFYGSFGPFLLVAMSGESENELTARLEANQQLLGDEFMKLWQKAMALTWKYETIDGRFRPDLTYIPE